jgi:hypothetical protein
MKTDAAADSATSDGFRNGEGIFRHSEKNAPFLAGTVPFLLDRLNESVLKPMGEEGEYLRKGSLPFKFPFESHGGQRIYKGQCLARGR